MSAIRQAELLPVQEFPHVKWLTADPRPEDTKSWCVAADG